MLFDQDSNPLSSEHSGKVKYTDNVELLCPTLIRDMFQYAQKVNEVQASFVELNHTINERNCVVEESCRILKFYTL